MREKQQTNMGKTTNKTKSLPFENELNSFIKEAKKNGCKMVQAIEYLREYWTKECNIPEENEKEKNFREKVKVFLDANYLEFDTFAYSHVFSCSGHWVWNKLDEMMNPELKKKFVYEVACSIYKAFEMDTLDRKELSRITLERTQALFPDIKAHSIYFHITLSEFLGYADDYEKPQECEEFVNQFELSNSYDASVCRFVWIVENFQP